jgi:hypothetical protein
MMQIQFAMGYTRMFDYIFKRPPGAPEPKPATPDAAPANAAKDAALAAAAALQGDEAAAVEFILQCTFADARLVAAAQIHSAPQLEAVVQAMRKTDRRVVKLLQGRLDEIRHRARSAQQAQECIAAAAALAATPRLLANQVADLDHAWQVIMLVDEQQAADFAGIRAQLASRLEAQASLQHEVLEVLAQLRMAMTSETEPGVLRAVLAECDTAMAAHLSQDCAAALPAHLLKDIDAARLSLLQHIASLEVKPVEVVNVAEVSTPVLKAKSARPVKVDPPELREEFSTALQGLETSLGAGVLHEAVDFDRKLRSPELQSLHLGEAQRNQLAALRIELARLQDWARWGGNVSREELHKAAEALATQALAPAELAKKVGDLRERWKALDTSAGPAPKDVWSRFDAACSAAYAPAAAHFKKLAEERDHNAAKARALIVEVRALVGSQQDGEAIDWKQRAHVCAQHTQAWQRLGVIERKLKKSLDGEFAAAMQTLSAPLDAQRGAEIERREALIAQALKLNPAERSALDTLRGLQERWQVQAKALPLDRKEEQALWLRFRAACDAVFAARKQVTAAADSDRREHQHVKEAICATLEAALALPEHEVGKALREASQAWGRAGHVPRAVEKKIDARYQAAIAALQNRLALARRVASETASNALRDKLRLCQSAETALAAGAALASTQAALWQNLPACPAPFEVALAARFNAAVNGDARYAALLEKNRAVLATELLRAEIMLSLDSPAEFSRNRLQLQVEVLQSSLKAGQKPHTPATQLVALCSLPALTDAPDAARIERIVERVQHDKA